MKKNWLLLLIATPVLFLAGIVAFGWFLWVYEPVPNENEVEEMVGVADLTEFGEVEGSYLLTPRNYGYYNDEGIYIVEQYLDKGREYGEQYVFIGEGMDLTDSDERAISHVKAKFTEQLLHNHYENLRVLSKHRMRVYRDDEKVKEGLLYKVIFDYEGVHQLTFILPEQVEEDKFNFFDEGYEQFLQF